MYGKQHEAPLFHFTVAHNTSLLILLILADLHCFLLLQMLSQQLLVLFTATTATNSACTTANIDGKANSHKYTIEMCVLFI